MNRLIALVLLAAFACDAQAAEFSVLVEDGAGDGVSDAVVTLTGKSAGNGGDASNLHPKKSEDFQMVQKDMQFQPHILAIPKGESVSFPNLDPFRHHVYSFSSAKPFELTLYGQGEARSVTFDEAGVVAVGCNIHDGMQAYIYVYDAQFAEKTDAEGRASFIDVPDGEYLITVWHSRLKPRGSQIERTVKIEGGQLRVETVNVDLRPARRPVRTHYN